MKLFLVERTDHRDYDEHDSAVIRAKSEEEVISKLFTLNGHGQEQLAYYGEHSDDTAEDNLEHLLKSGYNHYGLDGFTRRHTTITELTYDGESGVVISSFNAG